MRSSHMRGRNVQLCELIEINYGTTRQFIDDATANVF